VPGAGIDFIAGMSNGGQRLFAVPSNNLFRQVLATVLQG